MCQAFEGEQRALLSSEAFDRARRHEMMGRLARQDGSPREAWEGFAYHVDHASPDDPGTMCTPAWWMAHWFDGPLIRAWLEGWDDEELRIGAGGIPMDEDERREAQENLDRLHSWRHGLGLEGMRCRMEASRLASIHRLMGEPDDERFARGSWDVETKSAVEWVDAGIARMLSVLRPHLVRDDAR